MTDRDARRPVVVIADSDFGDHSIESEILGAHAHVRFAGARSAEDVVAAATDADALLVQYAPITATVLDSLPNLRVIVRYGSGLDNIDLVHASALKIDVRNVPDYCVDEVASHAAAAIQAASRRLVLYNSAVKRGEWGPAVAPPPLPPDRDPVGIVGYGRIGSALANRVARVGHPVLVFDNLAADTARADGYRCVDSVEELAAGVNHLSIHVPLSNETFGMVGDTILCQLGEAAHLVNAARGALIDEASLLRWLDSEPYRVASLDVLCQEPPVSGTSLRIAQHPRVVVTPHVAYLSTASLPRLRRLAALLVRDALAQNGAYSG